MYLQQVSGPRKTCRLNHPFQYLSEFQSMVGGQQLENWYQLKLAFALHTLLALRGKLPLWKINVIRGKGDFTFQ